MGLVVFDGRGSDALMTPELKIPIAVTLGSDETNRACMPPQLWPATASRETSTPAYFPVPAVLVTQSIAVRWSVVFGLPVSATPLGLPGPFGVPLERMKMPCEATSVRKVSKTLPLYVHPVCPQTRTGILRLAGGFVGAYTTWLDREASVVQDCLRRSVVFLTDELVTVCIQLSMVLCLPWRLSA